MQQRHHSETDPLMSPKEPETPAECTEFTPASREGMKMPKEPVMYVLRVRQPDGSWLFDMDDPMPKKDAEKSAKVSRILGGIMCQLWTEKEAREVLARPAVATPL